MKIKEIVLGIVFILSSFFTQAQLIPLSISEATKLKEDVVEKSLNTTSIRSSFEQYKHLSFLSNDIKSTGKLNIKTPNLIKWQYIDPFVYQVIFKGDKLYIDDDGKKSQVDLSSNKTFKSMNGLIVKSIKGDMFDEEEFDISYFTNGTNYVVKFQPKDATLKDMISAFEITFENESLNVQEIKMIESSEDYTRIVFIEQKLNENIPDGEFSFE